MYICGVVARYFWTFPLLTFVTSSWRNQGFIALAPYVTAYKALR
jgi:hypothetical protein